MDFTTKNGIVIEKDNKESENNNLVAYATALYSHRESVSDKE